jgi:SAM-dependent methyltransferase
MDRAVYLSMAAHEHKHWWFVGRRAYIDAVLRRLRLGRNLEILEAGCGTGGNVYVLSGHGHVVAFEPDPTAIALAKERHASIDIVYGRLPDEVPFPGGTFDLVAALDVLEHVDDDQSALASLVGLARPGGHVVITVPAHQFLFGKHDARLHHRRRYTRRDLHRLLAAQEADVIQYDAFNTVLAPIALVYRLVENVTGLSVGDQERLPPAPVNSLFAMLFSLERHVAGHIPPPLGLSYLVVLRKPMRSPLSSANVG